MLEPGSPLPNVSVVDETGAPVALRDFVGKRLVVWFYPKADTPG
jgi:peroxiredoxin Q/BCP